MKTMIVSTKRLILALIVTLTTTVPASAMSYEQARNEALFLTDKMAYELNLTDAQYEAAYEINLDYLMGVTSYNDVFGTYWERRNLDLSYILYSWQWEAFRAATYFYRPLYWDAGYWHFAVYSRYPHRDYFYFGRPHFYATYRGGHSWHMNGGRSYYHGRIDHFRPARTESNRHFGMRDGFDRGDYRGSRAGSSTRVTGRQDRRFDDRPNRSDIGGSRSGSYNQNSNGRFGSNRSSGSINRPSGNTERPSGGINRPSGSTERPSGSISRPSGSTERPSGSINRPSGSSGSSATPSRSFGGSRSSGNVGSSSRSSGSMGTRSAGSPSGSRPSGSSAGSRSSGSSNSHGHFGGSRSNRH